MAATVKTVVFSSGEDVYRKNKMVNRLEARGLLSAASKNFILKGRR
jgi:hypothetical protein